jgi:hypothetical protein
MRSLCRSSRPGAAADGKTPSARRSLGKIPQGERARCASRYGNPEQDGKRALPPGNPIAAKGSASAGKAVAQPPLIGVVGS